MRNLKFIIATVLLGLMASCSEDSMDISTENETNVIRSSKELLAKYNDMYFISGTKGIYIHNGKIEFINRNRCEQFPFEITFVDTWEENGDLHIKTDSMIYIMDVEYSNEHNMYIGNMISTNYLDTVSPGWKTTSLRSTTSEWVCLSNEEPPFTI